MRRNGKAWMLAGILGGSVILSAGAASPCLVGPPAAVYAGDFNGDGRPDRAWFVPFQALGRAWVDDPWTGFRHEVKAGAPVLVMALGGQLPREARCRLIQNPRFFSTPIWAEEPRPVRVLAGRAVEAAGWRLRYRRWQGDALLLATEAGPEILLFWDGRRFRIGRSREVP